MATQKPKNILIAPLDWGLGHTTRCVPLIRHIRALGGKAIFAGNGWQRSFIRETFGDIDTIDLEGYNVVYSKWNKWMQAGLLSQLPGLYKKIGAEHKWLKQKADELKLHGIISDNRYGLFHTGIPSVIITHQLRVQTGMGGVMDRTVQKIHYRHLNRFNEVWAPDVMAVPGLGGCLSHSPVMPRHSKYIGLLSQFAGAEVNDAMDGSLLILLSGPEPQRTDLSRILWQQALDYKGKVVFVEGNENAVPPGAVPSHITYHARLTNEALAPVLRAAGMVICRSGYSTIMDLVALRKKAILIPTPGQTEQESLAKNLQEQSVFYTAQQKGFDLNNALKEADKFPYKPLSLQENYSDYKQVIEDWVKAL